MPIYKNDKNDKNSITIHYRRVTLLIFFLSLSAVQTVVAENIPESISGESISAVSNEPESIGLERKRDLKNLLLQDCGSCHGMTLKGGLGPALTKDVMAGRSRDMLFATISEGRQGTPMPPWKNILTQSEINWLVDTLYKGINNEN
ncbi:Cytochrome c55X precursor NirC [hydrothermal vent metagenome]|uniref:Cytochrome c55X NirC n=1 Tax=hydrothermal vent metagenome TaxID=652676 RepID=A0A3B0YJ29_9ZZZZ